MNRFVPLSLGIVGLLILAPGATVLTAILHGLTDQDVGTALTPLTRIPLDGIGKRPLTTLKVVIPDTAQWKRIRREWGDPAFTISAVSSERQFAYCLPELAMGIYIYEHGNHVPMEISYPAYGYSTDCQQSSLKFRAAPGTELLVTIARSSQQSLPTGELIVIANWPYTKDKLVGHSLDRELRPTVGTATIFGAMLVAVAVYLHRRRVLRPRS
jgi:hypothetical protein